MLMIMVYGGTKQFENNIISKLKNIFKFGTEDCEAFTYVGIDLKQNPDFSIDISQNDYIKSISEIYIPTDI